MRKSIIIYILFFFGLINLEAQENLKMFGSIDLSLNDKEFASSFKFTGISNDKNRRLCFILNQDLFVESISINGENIKYQTKPQINELGYKYYYLKKCKVLNTDSLTINVKGNFKKRRKRYDFKGLISYNNSVIRATEQSKWMPVILENNKEKKLIYYNLDVKCSDCKLIYLNDHLPQKSPANFISETPKNNTLLVAGDINWIEKSGFSYINFSDNEIKVLDSISKKIIRFYEEFTGIKFTSKMVFAKLKTDNKYWGGFSSFPSVVLFKEQINPKNINGVLSHELAHFYFGYKFRFENELYWFYTESLTEYLSMKYCIKSNDFLRIKNRFKNFKRSLRKDTKREERFVRLDKVKKKGDIGSFQRYNMLPFQLLGIENTIGEKRMKSFLNNVISLASTKEAKAKDKNDGVYYFFKSLKKTGVSQIILDEIYKKYIKKTAIQHYEFLGL